MKSSVQALLFLSYLGSASIAAAASTPVITNLNCGSQGKIVVETFEPRAGMN